MKELIEKIIKFRDERNWKSFHNGVNLAKSISIEAAELLELFQWQDEVSDVMSLAEELADVLIYSLTLASLYKLDVKRIIEDKLVKNAIKYPLK